MAEKLLNEKIGRELQEFRIRNRMNQTQIGKELGISQVQVSRIEKNEIRIADNIAAKIQKLLKKPLFEYVFNSEVESDKMWKYSYHVYPEKYSGDSVILDTRTLPDKTMIFHADAVGSDLTASANIDLIGICSQTIGSTIEMGSGPEVAYYKMNKMYKNIKTAVRGEPSISIIFASQFFEKIEFVNGGMPDIMLYKKDGKINTISEKKFPAVGLLGAKDYVSSTSIDMQKGDVLFSFSDGFIEFYKQYSSTPLETFLVTISNTFKGDADSIGNRLAKQLGELSKNRTISDDLSYLVISKK